ncbi:MAG: hypothetical protein AAGG68_18035 [Bacteroidota bacterium]
MKRLNTLFFFLFYQTFLLAQITNVQAKLNKAEDTFIITYDLEEGAQGYWDVRLIAFIDGIRIEPSRVALSGAIGWQVRAGKKQKLYWKAFEDVENIDGIVRFEVWANESPFPPPPKAVNDWIIGGSGNLLGLGIVAPALPDLLSNDKIEVNATPDDQPILFYQTFCDPQSIHFDPNLVIPEQESQISACDQHFLAAEKGYQSAILRTQIGGSLALLGGAILLIKPINRYIQKPKYLRKYGLSMRPVLQLESYASNTRASFGFQLTSNF